MDVLLLRVLFLPDSFVLEVVETLAELVTRCGFLLMLILVICFAQTACWSIMWATKLIGLLCGYPIVLIIVRCIR